MKGIRWDRLRREAVVSRFWAYYFGFSGLVVAVLVLVGVAKAIF
jgi:hypothetical protein